MSDFICYVNGDTVPLSKASISVRDLAVLRGYGIFDFLRTYNGKPFRLKAHLLRLQQSAQVIGLKLPYSLETIETIVYDTLKQNNLPNANIRIVVTGGLGSDAITPDSQSGLIVIVTPAHLYEAHYYEKGIKVITIDNDRYLPHAKTINYIPAIIALQKAKAANATEALYTNVDGHILEGTTTNFFIFHGSKLITPKDNILFGVTRNAVLEVAEQNDVEVIERPITIADVKAAGEAFITSSNKEIMPVYQVNDIELGNAMAGPNTRHLMRKLKELISAELE